MAIALIDADIVAYRCAAVTENESESIALHQVDELMSRILSDTLANEYKAFLTGEGNFRRTINPDYKANRKDKPKPKHLKICQDFLQEEWNAEWCVGYEADDALGINATDKTIICSIDKDLLMIPGLHYNFVKQMFIDVNELSGIKHFWKQMLIGDTSDNIKGVDKIGPVKAAKLIDYQEYEMDMFKTVYDIYQDRSRFEMNADCLWIWRKEGETWTKRNSGLVDDYEASLQQQLEEDSEDILQSLTS